MRKTNRIRSTSASMKFLLPLCICLQFQVSFSQSIPDSTVVLPAGNYLRSYWDNGLKLVSQPVRWKGRDWVIFGGSLAITPGLTRVDEDINKPFKRWDDKNNSFGKAGGFLGSTPVIIGSALATAGIAYLIKSPRLKNFALDDIQALVFAGGLTYVTKNAFGRARPYQGLGANYWAGPFKSNDYQSFFSGHSAIAFSTATMIFLHSHKKIWVGLVSYGMATGIGISRMHYQKHWASDVFLGAVSGWAVSSFVYHQNEKRRMGLRVKTVL